VLDCSIYYDVEMVYEDEPKEIDATIGNGFFDKQELKETAKVSR